jgi:hypothetical protein
VVMVVRLVEHARGMVPTCWQRGRNALIAPEARVPELEGAAVPPPRMMPHTVGSTLERPDRQRGSGGSVVDPRPPAEPPPSIPGSDTLMTPPVTSEEAPHIAAIKCSVNAGFRFVHLHGPDSGAVEVIHAERWSPQGVVETYTFRDTTEALAARFRSENYPYGDPLWEISGTVAEVIMALLDLPPHGAPRAPVLARPASSSLWLPAGVR